MSNNQNDEQLFIPEALHMLMMQIEAARIECGRMQAELQSDRMGDFVSSYAQQPALPAIPVERTCKTEGTIIYAAHRFVGNTSSY